MRTWRQHRVRPRRDPLLQLPRPAVVRRHTLFPTPAFSRRRVCSRPLPPARRRQDNPVRRRHGRSWRACEPRSESAGDGVRRPAATWANSSEQSTRTGKNPINERYADCVRLWDRETHMSKADWSRTCRRIENRLQNLQVENLNVDVSGPKPRKTGKSPGDSG
jgi:hypothetical protein